MGGWDAEGPGGQGRQVSSHVELIHRALALRRCVPVLPGYSVAAVLPAHCVLRWRLRLFVLLLRRFILWVLPHFVQNNSNQT